MRLSVKQITNPVSLDSLGNALPGGMYDPAMGPLEQNSRCPALSVRQDTAMTLSSGLA